MQGFGDTFRNLVERVIRFLVDVWWNKMLFVIVKYCIFKEFLKWSNYVNRIVSGSSRNLCDIQTCVRNINHVSCLEFFEFCCHSWLHCLIALKALILWWLKSDFQWAVLVPVNTGATYLSSDSLRQKIYAPKQKHHIWKETSSQSLSVFLTGFSLNYE